MTTNLVERFFRGTSQSYDLVVNLFTYGADRYWKKEILKRTPRGDRILDLACGTGILTLHLARVNPCSQIIGVDVMPEYLQKARQKILEERPCNIQLVCGKAEEVTFRTAFDCVTSSYIPKYVPAERLVPHLAPLLKHHGVLILHDFAYPETWLFRKLWELHMILIKLAGWFLFPEWRTVFKELAGLVRTSQWVAEYRQALDAHGFRTVEVARLTAGSAALLVAEKVA